MHGMTSKTMHMKCCGNCQRPWSILSFQLASAGKHLGLVRPRQGHEKWRLERMGKSTLKRNINGMKDVHGSILLGWFDSVKIYGSEMK